MNRNLQKWNLQPADRIVVPKSDLRMVQHHAIYLGKDEYGTDWIAENKFGKGVQIVTASEFFSDVIEITRVEPFKGKQHQRNEAVQLAVSLEGQNYDLFAFNCEHYANVVQYKVPVSHQAKTGVGIGLLALLLGLIFIND
ncbi:MAG: hypothetical protein JNJ58_12430 [Chitinophagaceae bacterium]|nr:hypothetical protein [Chitinophagaceae bacterium]